MGRLNWAYPVWLEHEFAKLMVEMGDEGLMLDVPLATEKMAYAKHLLDKIEEDIEQYRTLRWDSREAKVKGGDGGRWYEDMITKYRYWSMGAGGQAASVAKWGSMEREYLKAPFKKDGSLSAVALKWLVDSWLGEHEATSYYTVDGIQGPFSRINWEPINMNSNPQKVKWMLQLGWKPTTWNTKNGAKGTDGGKIRTTPKLTPDSYHTLPGKMGKRFKLRGVVADRYRIFDRLLKNVREDGTVKTGGDSLGAATGRITHRLVVNMPGGFNPFAKWCRRVLHVKDDRVMVGVDAKSCQLRLLCHYMDDPDYAHAVVYEDVHEYNRKLLEVPARSTAKRFIFGFLFGQGDEARGKGDAVAGKKLADTFKRNLPKLDKLMNDLKETHKQHGYLRGIDGRMIQVDSQHKLLVYLLQCAEAVLMKAAAIIAVGWIKDAGIDAPMVWHYHDEYAFSAKPEDAERVKYLGEQAITAAGNQIGLKIPHEGDGKIGKNMWETH